MAEAPSSEVLADESFLAMIDQVATYFLYFQAGAVHFSLSLSLPERIVVRGPIPCILSPSFWRCHVTLSANVLIIGPSLFITLVRVYH